MDPITVDPNDVLQRVRARAAQDYAEKLQEIAQLETYVAMLVQENQQLKSRVEELEQLDDSHA